MYKTRGKIFPLNPTNINEVYQPFGTAEIVVRFNSFFIL